MSISKKILDNPAANLWINTVLVYGVAFAGRKYLNIPPAQAALFALGTFIANDLGKRIARYITTDAFTHTCEGRMIQTMSFYVPVMVSITTRFFSPFQTLAMLGLIDVCSRIYSRFVDIFINQISSPWNLKV